MKIFLFFLNFCFALSLCAQNVVIPDTNFKAAIISNGVDTNNDGEIQIDEAKAIESLSVSKKNINDLSGIEAFENVRTLFCDGNNLTRLDLSKNVRLSGLVCESNQIFELDLSKNPKLSRINCDSNNLSKLDFISNPLLWEISCKNNQLTSLKFLGAVYPFNLECSYNKLEKLDFTSTINVATLKCSHNYIPKLDISKQKRLQVLDCSFNVLTNLNLSNHHFLSRLNTSRNPTLLSIVINTRQVEVASSDTQGWQKDKATKWKVDRSIELPKKISYNPNCY